MGDATVEAIAKAADAVQQASRGLEHAAEVAAEASREVTAARNRLHVKQRDFDELVGQFKRNAPPDTDWSRSEPLR